jgi:hypothetical protein
MPTATQENAMNDPFGIAANLFMLLFVPTMLVAPLAFALCIRSKAASPAQEADVRRATVVLIIATIVALGLWLGATVAGTATRNPILMHGARFLWVLFFPLAFGFAMPLVRLKNPAWGEGAPTGAIRTASLVNRRRCSPIGASTWTALALLWVAIPVVVAARWFAGPFPDDSAQFIWSVVLATAVLQSLLLAIVLPISVRAILIEPEPLDAAGSPDLARLYEELRTTKLRGMVLLLGAAMPIVMGTAFVLFAWFQMHGTVAWIGAIGGTAIGLAGAWFGTAMSIRRVRIAELRSELDRAAGARSDA